MATVGATRRNLYAQLSRLVKDAGLLQRRLPGHYAVTDASTVVGFAACRAGLLCRSSPPTST
jgi:hypothetical protein